MFQTFFAAYPVLTVVLLLWLILGVVTFFLCGWDKYRAKSGGWRVPERTFFVLSLLGASPFMLLGMYTFRHKTKHKRFTILVPLILVLQIALLIFFLYRFGAITFPTR